MNAAGEYHIARLRTWENVRAHVCANIIKLQSQLSFVCVCLLRPSSPLLYLLPRSSLQNFSY